MAGLIDGPPAAAAAATATGLLSSLGVHTGHLRKWAHVNESPFMRH